jgi:hypothetical protein
MNNPAAHPPALGLRAGGDGLTGEGSVTTQLISLVRPSGPAEASLM